MSSVHRPTFATFVRAQQWTRGAELGIDKGILFDHLLATCPALHLIGVDVCPVPHRRARCEAIAATYRDRATLHILRTDAAAALVDDGSLDFVFIDADHSYAAVADDIARWTPKVRPGGWVGGHDYHPRKWPGVVRAVEEAFTTARIHTMPGTIWGVWR